MFNLSYNALGSLDVFPIEMQQLLVLDLSHNRIRSIARDTLRHLTKLVRLDLRDNLLDQIMPDVLRPLESIKALGLAHNSFSSLPVDSIKAVEYTLEKLDLEGRKYQSFIIIIKILNINTILLRRTYKMENEIYKSFIW